LDDHLGGIEVDEMILLKWILREVWCNNVDSIRLAQDKVQWQTQWTMSKENSTMMKSAMVNQSG
jgi:hypothetical protein